MSTIAPQPVRVETSNIRMLVSIDVAPRTDQSLEEAAVEMRQLFTEYLSNEDSSFHNDYAASHEVLAEYYAGEYEDEVVWGGYEGPFATDVSVIEPQLRIIEIIADLNSGPISELNHEYLRGQIELAINLLGYEDDGYTERTALLDSVMKRISAE